jgi:2-succinyl-5-enolpyruvyl-6-hydroxy-3-cyclohexene-1-carboxylate synthase
VNVWEHAVGVVESAVKAGIREFVVCAGARNAALVEALARAEEAGLVKLWRHFEERGAGFFALGRTIESGNPCAVVTTSGTAVAELLPAVIEAYYQSRPLVALTADRPARFRGTGSPQTIDQTGIFGPHAVAGNPADWDGRTPLHWNVELEEEFVPDDDRFAEISPGGFVAAKERLDVAKLARWLREESYKGMVVLVGGLEPDEREEVFHFCRALEAPVAAEATSGLREAFQGLTLHDADRVLKSKPPGKILRLGDVPGGRFWRDLEELPEVSVWSVCRNGLPGLARKSEVTKGEVERVLQALGDIEPVEDALDYLPDASRNAAAIEELIYAFPESEPGMLSMLSQYASMGAGLFLGNSMPIREWNLFAQRTRPVTFVRANRGANGIDGQISTWFGASAEISDSWAIVGDLTAMYDVSAGFLLGQINQDGRVLAVINNGGGKIFGRLPRLKSMSPRAAECMTNPHGHDFKSLAEGFWGVRYHAIRRESDWDSLEIDGDRMIVVELFPDERETRDFWTQWDSMRPQ